MNVKSLILTGVLSTVCGFAGAGACLAAFQDQLKGEPGPPGATGPAGPRGAQGEAPDPVTTDTLVLREGGVSVEYAMRVTQETLGDLGGRVAALEATKICQLRSDVVTNVRVGFAGDLSVDKQYGVCLRLQ